MDELPETLQTIIHSWLTLARREREKLGMSDRIDPYPEYRAGYAYGLESAAEELAEALAEALQKR